MLQCNCYHFTFRELRYNKCKEFKIFECKKCGAIYLVKNDNIKLSLNNHIFKKEDKIIDFCEDVASAIEFNERYNQKNDNVINTLLKEAIIRYLKDNNNSIMYNLEDKNFDELMNVIEKIFN